MNSNSRPVFCFEPKPKLIWNEVSDAVVYKFKLIERDTSKEMWTMEVTGLECENGTCFYDYPQDKQSLEPLVYYQFVAEAYDNEKCLKKCATEAILLEESVQQAFKELVDYLSNKEKAQEFDDKFYLLMKAISTKKNGVPYEPCRCRSLVGFDFVLQN